jgi:hypothetical protein
MLGSVTGMETNREEKPRRVLRIASKRLPVGTVIETIYSEEKAETRFAVCENGKFAIEARIAHGSDEVLEPVSAANNLVRYGVVTLPETPEDYGSTEELALAIQDYIYRYVDISDHFRKIASFYVLLTWVYDAFNELPYLRLRGDYGSGKTRALLVIGSICNKAFFASGASTVSPIFHTLDLFRGTLIFDEADFRFSDEKSELVKILNNGNVRGFPVLRTAVTAAREFDPRAFNVYGPKIVAMRKAFEDAALESRFITEEMGQRRMRHDIPINLPDTQREEAKKLRNQLLMYRFRTLASIKVDDSLVDRSVSARLNQILVPLLSIITDDTLRTEVRESLEGLDQRLSAERSESKEAHVLDVLHELCEETAGPTISIAAVTEAFAKKFAGEYERPITNRFIGGIVRSKLRLMTYKSHGVYVIPLTERPKIDELCIRYGVLDRRDG